MTEPRTITLADGAVITEAALKERILDNVMAATEEFYSRIIVEPRYDVDKDMTLNVECAHCGEWFGWPVDGSIWDLMGLGDHECEGG